MSTSATPSPIVKAFLVCDQVIHDAQTGKKSLIGVFHELRAERFPAVHPMLWIYANITEARGKYRIEIQLVDVDRNTVLGRGQPPEIDIPGPLQTTEISAQLRNVALPGPGTYEFHLLVNDDLLATKAVRVSGIQGGGGATPA
ncbi:MAG: hypothetical protein AB7T63_16275 [Planctomycetota bacterium]